MSDPITADDLAAAIERFKSARHAFDLGHFSTYSGVLNALNTMLNLADRYREQVANAPNVPVQTPVPPNEERRTMLLLEDLRKRCAEEYELVEVRQIVPHKTMPGDPVL